MTLVAASFEDSPCRVPSADARPPTTAARRRAVNEAPATPLAFHRHPAALVASGQGCRSQEGCPGRGLACSTSSGAKGRAGCAGQGGEPLTRRRGAAARASGSRHAGSLEGAGAAGCEGAGGAVVQPGAASATVVHTKRCAQEAAAARRSHRDLVGEPGARQQPAAAPAGCDRHVRSPKAGTTDFGLGAPMLSTSEGGAARSSHLGVACCIHLLHLLRWPALLRIRP